MTKFVARQFFEEEVDMAKAKKLPEEFTVELALSRVEAETLLRVTEKIGGSSSTSGRKHMDAIASALDAIGICISSEPMTGSIDIG